FSFLVRPFSAVCTAPFGSGPLTSRTSRFRSPLATMGLAVTLLLPASRTTVPAAGSVLTPVTRLPTPGKLAAIVSLMPADIQVSLPFNGPEGALGFRRILQSHFLEDHVSGHPLAL